MLGHLKKNRGSDNIMKFFLICSFIVSVSLMDASENMSDDDKKVTPQSRSWSYGPAVEVSTETITYYDGRQITRPNPIIADEFFDNEDMRTRVITYYNGTVTTLISRNVRDQDAAPANDHEDIFPEIDRGEGNHPADQVVNNRDCCSIS